MPLLAPKSGSYNDVPEKIPTVDRAVYDLFVDKGEVKQNKDKNGNNFVVDMHIHNDCPFKGRRLTLYLGLPNPNDSEDQVKQKEVRIKQFFMAAGVAPDASGNFDTDAVNRRIVKAEVGPNTYVDKSGATQENSGISRILKPDGSQF